MWISRYICLFMIYGVLGWIYESTFCTIKTHKWENRGFLYGPFCPIYGVGAVIGSLIVFVYQYYDFPMLGWEIFLISFFGSMILEYVTSWGLEIIFHAIWWDYSDMPLNVNGRISLFSSIGFGFGGMLIVYYIVPFVEGIVDSIPAIMIELLAIIFIMLFSIDMTLTVSALTRFEEMVLYAEKSFDGKMGNLVENAHNRMYYYGRLGKLGVRRVNKFRFIKINSEKVNKLLSEIKSNKKTMR